MKDSNLPSTATSNAVKRTEGVEADPPFPFSVFPLYKKPKPITQSALVRLQFFDVPLISSETSLPVECVCLQPDRPYSMGRAGRKCDFIFNDGRVSKQHCQILFDGVERKIYVLDGAFLLCSSSSVVGEFRRRVLLCDPLGDKEEVGMEGSMVKASLNGVFVNGVRIKRGMVRELHAGDEVLLVCGNEGICNLKVQIGFMIQGIVFKEEVTVGSSEIQLERPRLLEETTSMGHSQGSVSSGNKRKRVFAVCADEIIPSGYGLKGLKCGDIVGRAKFLSSQCRRILHNDDPVSYILHCALSDSQIEISHALKKLKRSPVVIQSDTSKLPVLVEHEINTNLLNGRQAAQPCKNSRINQDAQCNQGKSNMECGHVGVDHLQEHIDGDRSESAVAKNSCKTSALNSQCEKNCPPFGGVVQEKTRETCCPPPGKKFYLNRLKFMGHGSSSHDNVVSLPELLYPIESTLRIFIATFTSDILWFLSYCEIPSHLPVTIACHNAERCWSSNPDKRISMPYSDFPNLVVVFPPFPEAIAFGNDRKRQGIACHHPKFIVLQREDSIRVIITSANLVANQWDNVTNTVWWQDFPSQRIPDLSSLFLQVSDGQINHDSKSDFAAQLAGFMATLLIDVPSQAHWIIELTKYNFEGAVGHLIASVPGIHSCRTPYAYQYASESLGMKFVGSVEASVVGLSHLFHKAADSNGAQLKRLAVFLKKSGESACGMFEVVLRRNTNVPADVNAVSVLVPNPDKYSEDCVQLGFLPRNVAKWVSPLWDSRFFSFSGYVCPNEARAAALGGSNVRVQLILHVSQGPHFPDLTRMMQPEHVVAFCSLIASIQRCTGLWRLQEVLGQYKWPEVDPSDFVYGASSIGTSVNAQFLAAFSAAAGKRSLQIFDSEESDPEWGSWTASQELRNPSVRIVFPTIQRVKSACNGILPSRRILCFSEKAWQRLKPAGILHDAIPHPHDRVGHPMHTKVARRRFQSKTDATSCGWVYCGSHNFSAAAWGRPIANPFGPKTDGPRKTNACSDLQLRVCNYELGIIFIFPPIDTTSIADKDCGKLDDMVLPFIVPAPKYGPTERPATQHAMREALTELSELGREVATSPTVKDVMEEVPDEEEEEEAEAEAEAVEASGCVVVEREEEKAYAEMLWVQVD